VGRRSGFAYRLGDSIEVQVEKIEKADGKVELRLWENEGRGTGRRTKADRR